jgi:hypothetical protein
MVNLSEWLEEDEAAEAAEATSQNYEPEFITIHSDSDGPLDRLAETAEWEDILVYGAQWETAKPPDRETWKAFKRPGGTYDISAKVLKANPHVLVVHSDAAGLPYGKGQKLTKGRVYAHLHHNGDIKAAAQALARGAAVNLPAHVVDAVRSRNNIAGTVTEVTANQISDNSGEKNSRGRWVNLDQFLDGTYTPEQPSIGAIRDDGIPLLYPARWHTLIALTAAGKTTLAIWQVKAVLEWGGHVVYIHFEEASPNGIIHRLIGLGVSTEVIRKRFHWGHVDSAWTWGEMAAEIERLEVPPLLAILDGTNAACGIHGWDVNVNSSVGLYRVMFVHPLTKIGAAVLSLGHPPKATNRQSESYGYGAAGWLNDVDGVGYRMTASKTPIGKGRKGSSALYSVKDRYGEVERWGQLQEGGGMPWYYMGQFVVDDTLPVDTSGVLPRTEIHLTVPAKNEEGAGEDAIDRLGDEVLTFLRGGTGRFETVSGLRDSLRAKGVHLSPNALAPALERLMNRGLLEWPPAPGDRKPRPGWLTDSAINPEEP